MTPRVHMLCSFALTFGVPLVLAARELWITPRPKRDGGGPGEAPPVWPADGSRPLPDCLVPKLTEQPPVRVPELV